VNAVMLLLPLAVALLVVGFLLVGIVRLYIGYRHPLRIAVLTLSSATLLGVVGLLSILPASAWWVMWALTLAILGGVAVAVRRLLVRQPPIDPTPKEAKRLRAPGMLTLIGEVVVLAAVLVVAVAAG
jgi:Zn-dependent protease with chaperone function